MLPPEILDKIFDHLPVNKGRRTLISCALVASWWTGPSQRRLFSSVSIDNINYQQWMDGVVLSVASRTRLLPYVRSLLHYASPSNLTPGHLMQNLPNAGEYFPALCNLRSLTLCNTDIEHICNETLHTCFSVFRQTLTELSLKGFTTSFSMLVTVVGYFPNIATLRMSLFMLVPDEKPTPPLPQPLRGKLCICGFYSASLPGLADWLAKLDPEYDELVIESVFAVDTEALERVLQSSADTIKYLRLMTPLQRKHFYTLFSPCFLTQRLASQAEQPLLVSFRNCESWNYS